MTTKKLQHLDSLEAWALLEQHPDSKLVDIRSSTEFLFIGHPKNCIHIPWMEDPSWDINPNFVEEIQNIQMNNGPVIMICRSGNRSKKAGVQLLEAGLENIYHITDGFEGDLDPHNQRNSLNGWRFNGLPWEQC